ncbi:unnamed protein product [Bathycoccus prasinos]
MEDFERTTRVVSVVRVKRKRGSAEAAEVLFLQGKDEEEEEDEERKGNDNAGTDTNGMKRRIKKNRYTTSNNRNTIKNIKNDDFVKGRYDRELAAQLDAVLGGGSQALPFHRNSHQTTKGGEGEGDFDEDEDEKKTKKKKSNGMLKKFVRLTREAGMEQNDARDAQTVKTLLESRRKGEDGGGGKTTKASTRTTKTTKRTYEEVKVMSEDESMKSMTTTRRDHNITDEEKRKKRNVLSSSTTTTTTIDSTKEVFYCYDILCRDEEEEKIEEEEKEKEGKEEGNRNDEKIELEDQMLMNYMPMVKEYTEKKKREEEDADGNWVYDLYVLEQDDVVPKREGGTVETDDIICEQPIVRVSDFLDNANVEHNLHENEYFSEDDSEDSNAENYYRGDYPEEDTDDDDGFFDDGGDDSDRDEWDVDDEYDSDEEDDGYGRHRSDHGSGWGV